MASRVLVIVRPTGRILHVLGHFRGLFVAGGRHGLAGAKRPPDQSGAAVELVPESAPTDSDWNGSGGRLCSLHDYYKARPTWDIPH